jgi:predicted nucleotidyltransferase
LPKKEFPQVVHHITSELLARISKIDPVLVKGMYLTGSVALGDFHEDKSDIDFIILVENHPDKKLHPLLRQLHVSIEERYRKPNLSGCYITRENLDIGNAATVKVLQYNEGRLDERLFEMAEVTLYELKTTAVTTAGIPVAELPITIDLHQVLQFLHRNINSYWTARISGTRFLSVQTLQLILLPRLTEWIVLGVARQLYTLRTGKITSKTEAGAYCLENLPQQYHSIIREALEIRSNDDKQLFSPKPSYYIAPSLRRSAETIACASFIIRLFNQEYTGSIN